MGKTDVAGQYMIGQDVDTNPHIVLTDADGKLLVSGGGGGGGGDTTIVGDTVGLAKANQLPNSLLSGNLKIMGDQSITDTASLTNALKVISAIYAYNGSNISRIGSIADSLKVTVTNNTIESAIPVIPGNTTITATKGLYIGGLGDVVATINGFDVTMVNLAIGVWHPIKVTAIKATGTTATNILAGY